MTSEWPLRDAIEFGPLPGAVPCARLHTRLLLAEWGLTGLIEQAELVVSELITNAVAASQQLPWISPVRLWLYADTTRVLIAVWDANPRLPARSGADELAESGRGLLLVESLSAGWDAYPTADWAGKSSGQCAHWTSQRACEQGRHWRRDMERTFQMRDPGQPPAPVTEPGGGEPPRLERRARGSARRRLCPSRPGTALVSSARRAGHPRRSAHLARS